MKKVLRKYKAMFERPLASIGDFEKIKASIYDAKDAITSGQLRTVFIPEIERCRKEIRSARRKKAILAIILSLVSLVLIWLDVYAVWSLVGRTSYIIEIGISGFPSHIELAILCIIFSVVIMLSTIFYWIGYKKYNFKKIIVEIDKALKVNRSRLYSIEKEEISDEDKALGQLEDKYINLAEYQNVNIKHTKRIFWIGVFVIGVGIVIIIGTIIAALIFNGTNGIHGANLTQVIAGISGGVLVDGVGAVLIAMYTKISESAIRFQEGLIEINKAYLGNVFVSKIKNDEKLQNQTLSDMAKALSKRNSDSKKE